MYLVIILILAVLAAWFIFRKKRIVAPAGEHAQDTYEPILTAHVDYYARLNKADQLRFAKLIAAFLSDVTIEGIGTEVTDIDRVLIASSAMIPIFGLGDWQYKNLTNVILYPDTFDQEFQFEGENRNILGMVGSGYMNGQMLLSRAALLKGFSKSSGKENTAIHEFVHLLDKSDGATDGVPENLLAHQYVIPWLKMIHQEIHRIEQGKSDINFYATTNEAEFLAVASEYFFEKPEQLKHKHPELYQSLSQLFRQDPAKSDSLLNL